MVLTAIAILHEQGYSALTTREMARREGISEAAIFKHFDNKNEILIAMLDHYSRFDRDIRDSIGMLRLRPMESIVYWIQIHAELLENDPALTAITQLYEVLYREPGLQDKMMEIYTTRLLLLKLLLEAAQSEGQLKAGADCNELADIITGTVREICLRWRLTGFSFPLKERVVRTLKHVLEIYQIIGGDAPYDKSYDCG